MLSINIYLRFALIAVSLIAAIVLTAMFGFWYAFPFYLAFLILLAGYILLGTVQSAAAILQKEDFAGAEKRLNLTVFPSLLYATNKAYYYMLKGTIAMNNKENEKAEMWINKAKEVKVPTDNEKIMLELQLGNIAAQRNKWKQAKLHLKAAKQYKATDENIKEQIKQFERAIQGHSQMRSMNRPGGSQGMYQGGKRRRPKMR